MHAAQLIYVEIDLRCRSYPLANGKLVLFDWTCVRTMAYRRQLRSSKISGTNQRVAWISDSLLDTNSRFAYPTTFSAHRYFRHRPRIELKKKTTTSSSSASKLCVNFCKTTTCHGLARIVSNDEPLYLKIFYSITLFVMFCFMVYNVYFITYDVLVVRSLKQEFVVQINETMQLPTIHICDTSLFKRSALRGSSNYLFIILHSLRGQ